MITAVADTHAAIWYLSGDMQLSGAARSAIENAVQNGDQIAISSISLVEMVYLVEKGRIPAGRFTQLANKLDDPASVFVEVVDLKIARALSAVDVKQIPDMPDRIIAATALSMDIPVISRDSKISMSTLTAIW